VYEVRFYRDRNGRQPALDYLRELAKGKDKDSRIRARKMQEYLNLLQEFGTYIGEPAVKHLEGDIWELRPARDRVLFVAWHNNGYVLLHAFEKQTQKTPEREKQRARKEYADLKERGLDDE
jgi:phage-related protein